MPKFILDGDARGAVQAVISLTEAQKTHGEVVKRVEQTYADWNKKTIEWLKEQKKEAAAAAAESKRLGEEAQKIILANEGPQERYNRKVQELSRLFVAGKLSLEQMDMALARYRRELNEVEPLQERTFGSFSLNQLTNYISGLVSLSAVIGGISSAFRQMEQDAQKAADSVFDSLGAAGQLQQVMNSGPDGLKMVGQARDLVRQGIFPSNQQSQALNYVFALRNAEYTDSEMATITELGRKREVPIGDLETVAMGLKKYQATFGPKEAGDINQVLQKVRLAAGTMQTNFPKAAEASTQFGSEASALKFSDEEALAAFVAIEKQSPGTEEAATRLRGLLTEIAKKKLQKGTMTETVDSLVTRVRSGEQAIDVVGEIRAAAGLNILASDIGYKTFREQTAALQGVQNQPPSSVSLIKLDPRLRAADLRAKYSGGLAMSDEDKYAEKESLYDALKAEQLRRLGDDTLGRAFTRVNQSLIDTMGNEDRAFQQAVSQGGYPQDLMDAMKDYLERAARGIESLDNKTRSAPAPSGRQER